VAKACKVQTTKTVIYFLPLAGDHAQ